ncbi:hypothetical protein [Microbacterium sp.]|uniref:hypothetical protein n=1 Tax=Microbacterium sp. TaxID=51671 RepID=UPI003561FFE2
MKHVKYAEKSVLVGDDAADTLMDYARVLASEGSADTVTLRVVSPDGNIVDASFLLTPSTELMVESTNSQLEEPDNWETVQEMRDRIASSRSTVVTETEPPWILESTEEI